MKSFLDLAGPEFESFATVYPCDLGAPTYGQRYCPWEAESRALGKHFRAYPSPFPLPQSAARLTNLPLDAS